MCCFLQWQWAQMSRGRSVWALELTPVLPLGAPALSVGLGSLNASPRPGVGVLHPEPLSAHQHPSLPGHPMATTRWYPPCPSLPLHLQIQNTVHGDGEELTAALQTYDSLQGAAAKAERGSQSLHPRPHPRPSQLTRPSKVPRDSCRVSWWRHCLNWAPKGGQSPQGQLCCRLGKGKPGRSWRQL